MRRIAVVLGVLFLIILAYKAWLLPQMEVATGYAAKKMCSCHFIANRHPDSIQKYDLNMPFIDQTSTTFNYKDSIAETRLFGFAAQRAKYKGDLGCALIRGKDNYEAYLSPIEVSESPNTVYTDSVYLDKRYMAEAINYAFLPEHQTRALVIIHNGRLVKENYAPGYDSSSVFNGWSMTKSITATLIGMLVDEKKLALSDTALFEEWSDDDRRSVSLKDLLQMQSGLYFEEKYDEISTATNMLFRSEKVADIPLSQALTHPPGSVWHYSSGTSNILSELIRRRIDNDVNYHRLPYDSLFHRIGMNSAVLETDESGTFVGSSFCYATARDWAKFGQLYLQNGNWNGVQIIDSSWVDFIRTPASNSSGLYGGHFWLNAGGAAFPKLSEELFFCNGFQGQKVLILPDRELVIVRMGLSEEWNFEELLLKILKSISPEKPSLEAM